MYDEYKGHDDDISLDLIVDDNRSSTTRISIMSQRLDRNASIRQLTTTRLGKICSMRQGGLQDPIEDMKGEQHLISHFISKTVEEEE